MNADHFLQGLLLPEKLKKSQRLIYDLEKLLVDLGRQQRAPTDDICAALLGFIHSTLIMWRDSGTVSGEEYVQLRRDLREMFEIMIDDLDKREAK